MSAVAKIEKIEQPNNLPAVATPMQMLANAIDKGMAMETVDKLVALAERFDATQARKAFDRAIAAAKAEIPVIAKNATGHNAKKYADFASIARTVDPILSAHGLSYRFRTRQDEKLIHVTCVLSHEAGHSEETTLAGPADATGSKNAIQAIGSTLTYLQRYSLVQALGLAVSEDDDGRRGGNGQAITDEQATKLREVIDTKAVGTEARLLKWARVEKIGDITTAQYEEAIERLKTVLAAS